MNTASQATPSAAQIERISQSLAHRRREVTVGTPALPDAIGSAQTLAEATAASLRRATDRRGQPQVSTEEAELHERYAAHVAAIEGLAGPQRLAVELAFQRAHRVLVEAIQGAGTLPPG